MANKRRSRAPGASDRPVATNMPCWAWLASSGPVSFSRVQTWPPPTEPALRQYKSPKIAIRSGGTPRPPAPPPQPADPLGFGAAAPGGRLFERQIAFPPQPFIYADRAVHALGSVVGDDQDRGVGVDDLEERADLLVHERVVFAAGLFHR